MSARLSTCIGAASTGQIFVKLRIGNNHEESVEKLQICLKSGEKNVGHFTQRPKYLLLLQAT
jgi:hypothetical protein